MTGPSRPRGRWRARLRVRRNDRGAVAELAALLPVFILFFGLVCYGGRLEVARTSTKAAAQWAARTISAERNPEAAVADAETDAAATLEVGQPACQSMTFTPVITPTDVTVTISCSVKVADLILLPVPGTQTITASATEVRDQFQENSGEFGISEGSGGSNSRVGGR